MTGPLGLGEAVMAIGPPPCDECALSLQCASQLTACRDFQNYINQGQGLKVWPAERVPCTAIYAACFPEDAP